MRDSSFVLRNENGSAIVLTLVAALGMLLASYFINESSLQTEKQLRRNSIKNLTSIKAAQLNAFLYNYASQPNVPVGGNWLNLNSLGQGGSALFDFVVEGDASACGDLKDDPSRIQFCLVVQDRQNCSRIGLTSVSGIQGKIVVLGADQDVLRPVDVNFCREFRQLGVSALSCKMQNGRLRVITGINPDSTAACRELSPASNCPGSYGFIVGRDREFNISCRDLSANLETFSCGGDDQFIESISWTGNASNPIDAICGTRLDPYLKWPLGGVGGG